MANLQKITKAIIPLQRLGGTFGRNILEIVKDKLSNITCYSVSATKETKPMNVEFEKSGTVCNDCKPPSVMNRFRSFLKRRILDRTLNEQQKNESIDEKLARTRKAYPFFHAVEKENLPGAPMPGWQQLNRISRISNGHKI